jgi:hypothetical protein
MVPWETPSLEAIVFWPIGCFSGNFVHIELPGETNNSIFFVFLGSTSAISHCLPLRNSPSPAIQLDIAEPHSGQ